ncbi:uncharacterized protein BX664DRAFT_295547 [Halteromyces radiatus]|uniref:uncharacterized protein n=1 Tax=Halteromyces radiatus TaxID=101107 RepID=UPI00221E8996|nr:uncharacterized protein BX664DRAFT_295547 [Halteromyces radiatus]KAI8093654.1 hypothetical protein BX664DRAFT_295547 [Halteromyces radiatus]
MTLRKPLNCRDINREYHINSPNSSQGHKEHSNQLTPPPPLLIDSLFQSNNTIRRHRLCINNDPTIPPPVIKQSNSRMSRWIQPENQLDNRSIISTRRTSKKRRKIQKSSTLLDPPTSQQQQQQQQHEGEQKEQIHHLQQQQQQEQQQQKNHEQQQLPSTQQTTNRIQLSRRQKRRNRISISSSLQGQPEQSTDIEQEHQEDIKQVATIRPRPIIRQEELQTRTSNTQQEQSSSSIKSPSTTNQKPFIMPLPTRLLPLENISASSHMTNHTRLNLSRNLRRSRSTPPTQTSPLRSLLPCSKQVEQSFNTLPLWQIEKEALHIRHLSPISVLNDDCLSEIFLYCTDTTTLCRISSVCQHWRRVCSQPYIWKTIDYTWKQFVEQITPSNKRLKWTPYRQERSAYIPVMPISFLNIKYMTITDNTPEDAPQPKLVWSPSMFYLNHIKKLELNNMYLDDIMDLIQHTGSLLELNCHNIMSRPSNDTMMLTAFGKLQHLRVLRLHFMTMCELISPTSLTGYGHRQLLSTRNNNRLTLPVNLQILQITNVYDIEESLVSGRSVLVARQRQAVMDRLRYAWNEMENTLCNKYKVLNTLENLTELSLGHCSAYTARIWKECIMPCTHHLTRLSLCGWSGDGSRENPVSWLERHALAERTQVSIENFMEEVEKALADMLANLHSLQVLSLSQFHCGPGLRQGVERLSSTRSQAPLLKVIKAKCGSKMMHNNIHQELDINDLANWLLEQVEIHFTS